MCICARGRGTALIVDFSGGARPIVRGVAILAAFAFPDRMTANANFLFEPVGVCGVRHWDLQSKAIIRANYRG